MDQLVVPFPYEVVAMPAADAELLESATIEVRPMSFAGISNCNLDEICEAFRVPHPISIEPGHVMSWEKYRELEAQQK